MKTFATTIAVVIVFSVPVAAKTMLNDPQRVVRDYTASRITSIPNLYIEEWTEGYPLEQTNQLSVTERTGHQPRGHR